MNWALLINNTYDDRLLMNCLMKRRPRGRGSGVFADEQQFIFFYRFKNGDLAHAARCRNANVPGIFETAVIFLALHIS